VLAPPEWTWIVTGEDSVKAMAGYSTWPIGKIIKPEGGRALPDEAHGYDGAKHTIVPRLSPAEPENPITLAHRQMHCRCGDSKLNRAGH
jgi:hypothetical protein